MGWRKAESADDRAAWSEIFLECFGADEVPEPPTWGERWLYWGRAKARGPVRPLAIVSAQRADGGAAVYLSFVGVTAAARGRGLARAGIRQVERWARELGAKDVITYIHSQNHASSVSFIRCGYLPYSPDYAWVGRDPQWVYWIRRLLP